MNRLNLDTSAARVLKKVGWALIVVGLADIAYMVYCIVNEQAYSSSFNIFAVIAGALLVRQSLYAARVVAWFAAFLLAAFVGVALLFPLSSPLGLLAAHLRLETFAVVAGLAFAGAAIAFVFWVYRSLTSEVVLQAQRSAGLTPRNAKLPFVIGAALAIGLFGVTLVMTSGELAKKAMAIAQQELGPGFKYHVTAISYSGSKGGARVTAYNEDEIREISVTW